MLDDVTLQREDAHHGRRHAQLPRLARARAANVRMSSPSIAVRLRGSIDAPAARRPDRCQCVVASTIALANAAGSVDLKIPLPTKMPSAPSCIISAASAGVDTPPAQNSTTGSFFSPRRCARVRAARRGRARARRALLRHDRQLAIASRIARMWRTASTMLPLPASPLLRIIAAPSAMRRSASPRSRAPHTNGT
jgi:hypothetical protein